MRTNEKIMYLAKHFYFILLFYVTEISALKIEANNITLGLTRSLDVSCILKNESVPSMSRLYSLSLLHSKTSQEPKFQEIASVNTIDGLIEYIDEKSLNTSGQINSNGFSYLNLTFRNPTKNNTGVYKCEAYGFNSRSRPVDISSTALVQAESPDINEVITEIKKLRDSYESLKGELGLFNSRHKAAKNEFFIESSELNGKKYLLTKMATFYFPSFAQAMCSLYEGYLAEIDSLAEFEFVRNFIISKGSHFSNVMTGGTDEETEGIWINRHSKTPVASFWAPGEPNNLENEDCQNFYKFQNWYMNDAPCSVSNSVEVGFVCEIPV
ncbi:uncharacterized protein LOC106053504 [Biomphalaria glabrata]|uniref:Uncharacterized protein LOC106053504 n=1 Tax=Biomphalaria glabrata TaxID=6526 RepID=A0A9U8DWK1_BIOGL|nr:uncharacterized protein LOC106053504 [Biomphalaria glabrata]